MAEWLKDLAVEISADNARFAVLCYGGMCCYTWPRADVANSYIYKKRKNGGGDGISLVIKSWPGAPLGSILGNAIANAIVDTFPSIFYSLIVLYSSSCEVVEELHFLLLLFMGMETTTLKVRSTWWKDYVGSVFFSVKYAVVKREEKEEKEGRDDEPVDPWNRTTTADLLLYTK